MSVWYCFDLKGVTMAKQTIYNAGIYVRLSQEDMRAGESLSIENQKLILTKYVKEQGWNLVDTYVDDGWSGTDFDRPAVQRLLSDAQSGKINLIICKDLSRFGRNYIEVGRYVDYIFPSYNIRFIALNDNVDTASKDTSALDMMPIVNLFNEWHAASTSKKIKAVIEANAKAGKYRTTCAPFGYTKGDDPNHLPVIDPDAAPIVRNIFEMRASGISPHHIADKLNEDGVPIPSDYYYAKLGKPNPRRTRHMWSPETVRQILHNFTYLGHLVQLRTRTVSYKNHKVIKNDEEDMIVVKNTHEPKKIKLVIQNSITIDCTNGELDPMTKAFLQIAGVFGELEHDMICSRVKSGVANARAKGKQVGRPQKTLAQIPDKVKEKYSLYKHGDITKTEYAAMCGISRPTLDKYINLMTETL